MDISLSELKEKEIINVFDGKKLGHIIDILFDIENGLVRGIVVPGEKKFFKKSEDIFIPLEKLKKIGDDVVLVKLPVQMQNERAFQGYGKKQVTENKKYNYKNMQNYYGYDMAEYGSKEKHSYEFDEKRTKNQIKGQSQSNNGSYVRFKPINNKKYK